MSSMNDAASWLTTSARCARRRPRPPVTRPPPADIARTGSFMNVSRGAHANSSAIAVDDDEREGEHAAVEPDLADAAREPRGVRDQEIEAGDGERRGRAAPPSDRQHEVFREQLTPQERRRRAERGADAHLALALHEPRQREVARRWRTR